MYDSFSPDELELRSVISETLIDVDEVKSVQTIQTGWTNITMDVQCKKNDYIFRFPRNLFYSTYLTAFSFFCLRLTPGMYNSHLPESVKYTWVIT